MVRGSGFKTQPRQAEVEKVYWPSQNFKIQKTIHKIKKCHLPQILSIIKRKVKGKGMGVKMRLGLVVRVRIKVSIEQWCQGLRFREIRT